MRRKDREISEPAWIDETLGRSDACHLALIDGSKPYVISLNFGFERTGDGVLHLYFHCAREGKKLELIRRNPVAAFSADTDHELVTGESGCDWGMNYRSVAGDGTIVFVTDPAEKRHGLNLLMEHYSGRRDFDYHDQVFAVTEVLRLTVATCTGKQRK